MTVGTGAIGELAIGQDSAAAVTLAATDLTTGSPALGTPTLYPTPYAGIDANVRLMLHGDGADFSTTIIDSSPYVHTMTAHNGAALSTLTPKFGSAALAFDGVNDYIDTPDSTDFTLGSGDFTIDFWFNTGGAGNGTTRRLCGHASSTGAGSDSTWHFTLGTSNTLGFNLSNGSFVAVLGTTAITTGGWHHAAGVRTGNTLKFFLDGVQEGGDVSFSSTAIDCAGSVALGRRGDQNAQYYTGRIDEFRLSVGVARWTADFPVPDRAYQYDLAASDLTTGSPELGTPAFMYGLTAADFAPGSPVLDTPAASVFYPLTAADLVTGSPELGTPILYLGFTLFANDLETGSPELGTPAASVFYPLTASDLAPGSPDLGTPALMYALVASDLTTGSPDLDSPAASFHYDLLALPLTTAAPELDAPSISVHYSMFAFDFETGSPELDAPALYVVLIALDLETGSPELDAPACSHAVMPRAEYLVNLGDLLLDPIYGSMISNPARVFPTTPGLPAVDLLCINHTAGITVQFGIGVQTIRPAVDIRVRELEIYGVQREDLTNGQVVLWPDTAQEETWNIETVLPRPGIWGEPSGEWRLFLMDRLS